jgi:hypothetical protein
MPVRVSSSQIVQEYIVACGLPKPTMEYKFHPTRKWRFDLAYPKLLIAIEIDGGSWINGRHNRGSGFVKDCEKFNEAGILGWRILRFTPDMIESGMLIDQLKRITGWEVYTV